MPSIPSTITFLAVAVPGGGPDRQQVSANGSNRPASHAHPRRRPMAGCAVMTGAMVLLAGALAGADSGGRPLKALGCLLYTNRRDADAGDPPE